MTDEEKTKEQLIHELEEMRQQIVELRKETQNVKQTGIKLKENEETFINIAENCPNMIYINKMGRVVYVNKKCEEIMGYTREEFYSPDFDFLTLIAPEYVETIKENFNKYVRGDEHPLSYEYALITKKGRKIEAIINSEEIIYGGSRCLLGIVTDISDRKLLEAELRQSQKMAAIGTLAGGIAHEFNNLLFVISGNVELLKSTATFPENEDCNSCLDSILSAAKRATHLVRQILTFSRKSDKRLENVDLVEVIKEGLKMMRASVPSTIDIVNSVSISRGIVRADSNQMYQILVNLCANAIYVLQNTGGTMEVGLCRELRNNQSFLRLSVSDDGPGMPPEVKDRVFEPFFTTKPVGDGAGMGLPVVHGIVEDCGGNIEIVSLEGHGTAVHVFLPEHIEAGGERGEDPNAVEESEKKILRIMLVEDEPALCTLIKNILENKGHQVLTFPDGASALAIFRGHPGKFDLVITDQAMPRISGKDMGRKMLEIRPDIPIVLITGFSEVIEAEEAEHLGFFDFLLKPVDISEFDKIVNRIVSGEKF